VIELEHQLEQRFPDWFRGARARLARPLLRGIRRIARLDEIDAFLARHGHQQGLALVEAARFLAFGVDPDFNNAVDGLVELDLARIRPRKRERYLDGAMPRLGKTEAA